MHHHRKWIGLAVIILALVHLSACFSELDRGGATSPSKDEIAGGSVILICEEGAQFELISPQNDRVLFDISDPSMLSSPPRAQDILLTTHLHGDHYNEKFTGNFPGRQLFVREGRLDRGGLLVQGIAAKHSEHTWDIPKPEGGNNYIFIIETSGLRIAHFGDIGQKRLTASQLETLGRIDVAITQFINPYSQMNLENLKGYQLMDQLNPRIIIPHHGAFNEGAVRQAMNRWNVVCAPGNCLRLSADMLPDRTTVLLMGEMTGYIRKTFNLKTWLYSSCSPSDVASTELK